MLNFINNRDEKTLLFGIRCVPENTYKYKTYMYMGTKQNLVEPVCIPLNINGETKTIIYTNAFTVEQK